MCHGMFMSGVIPFTIDDSPVIYIFFLNKLATSFHMVPNVMETDEDSFDKKKVEDAQNIQSLHDDPWP